MERLLFHEKVMHAPFMSYSFFYILNHSLNYKNCDVMAYASTGSRVPYPLYHLAMKRG